MGLEGMIIVVTEAHDYDRVGDRAKGVAMQCRLAAAWNLSLDFVSPSWVLEPCLFSGEIRNFPPGKNRLEPCYSSSNRRRQLQVAQNVAVCFLW